MEKMMEERFKGKQRWIERNTHKQTRKITDTILKQVVSHTLYTCRSNYRTRNNRTVRLTSLMSKPRTPISTRHLEVSRLTIETHITLLVKVHYSKVGCMPCPIINPAAVTGNENPLSGLSGCLRDICQQESYTRAYSTERENRPSGKKYVIHVSGNDLPTTEAV